MEFEVFIDGSCKGNPGKGGFAYIAYDKLGEIWADGKGFNKETTNNQMEMSAAIEVLKIIEKNYKNYKITIYSDSSYVVNCFKDGWIEKWEQNNWKTSEKKDVLNKEMWIILNDLVRKTNATFVKVLKSDERLKVVDKIAKEAARKPLN